jgi:antitoxin (DNA-binding transcriptional repressor) of toxin-antitoxin stability system
MPWNSSLSAEGAGTMDIGSPEFPTDPLRSFTFRKITVVPQMTIYLVRISAMKIVSLTEAKAHLSRLVEETAAGEPVCITRRGKAVAPDQRGWRSAEAHRRGGVAGHDRRHADAVGDRSRLYSTDAR